MEEKEFSVAQFFKAFEKALARIDTYPLNPKNLIIQQDAYKRLYSEEEEPGESFASISYVEREKDSDLLFRVDFTSIGIIIECEFFGTFFLSYDDKELFQDETDAVTQLISFLSMVCNGQLAAIVTTAGSFPVAKETILYEGSDAVPFVTSTEAYFPRSVSGEDLNFHIVKNHYGIPFVKLPKKAFFIDVDPSGKPLLKGRKLSRVITPLTPEAYKELIDTLVRESIGQRPNESNTAFLLRSWEFWVMCIVLGGAAYLLRGTGYLPSIFVESPALLLPITTIISAFLALMLMSRKEARRANNKASILLQIDSRVEAYSARLQPKEPHRQAKEARKSQRWIVITILYVCAAMMIAAGVIFMQTLPAESITFGSPLLFGSIIVASAVVMFILADRYRANTLKATIYMWAIPCLVILSFLPLGLALKENITNQGSDIGWMLLFLSPFLALATLWVEKRRRQA